MSKFLYPALFLSTLFSSSLVLAESLEEIVVSATSAEQESGHASLSHSRMTSEWINDLYVDSFEELSFFVPGLYIQEQSINSAGYAIRGITSDNAEASRTPRVSVWLHGMDISRSQGAYISMFDIEAVDVYKGPNSALFATGGQIGGVNIQNAFAKLEDSDSIYAQYGNFNELKFTGHANFHLGGNNAIRFAVFKHDRDGYIENSDDTLLGSIDSEAIRVSTLFGTEKHYLDTQITYEKNSPTSVAFQSFTENPSSPDDPFSESNLSNGDNLRINRTIIDVFNRYTAKISDSINFKLSALYRDVEADETFDPDGFSINIVEAHEDAEYQTGQIEAKIEYLNHFMSMTLGASYFVEDVDVTFAATIDEELAIRLQVIQDNLSNTLGIDLSLLGISTDLYLNGLPNPYNENSTPAAIFDLSSERFESQTESVENSIASIFGDFNFTLPMNLELGLGFRYSEETLETSVFTEIPSIGSELSVTDGLDLFLRPESDTQRRSSAEESSSGLTGHISLVHYLVDQSHIYWTYSRGRRPNILNFTESSSLEFLQEETVDSYEVGFTFFLSDLYSQLTGSIYRYDFENFTTLRSGVEALAFIADDNANATITGVELAYTQFLGDSWLLFSNVTYNDSVFDESEIIEGENRFRYAPEWVGSLSISKDFIVSDAWSGRVTTQARYQSKVYFEDDNSTNNGRNSQGGYAIYNLYLEFSWLEKLTLGSYLINATDKEYIIDAGNFGQLFGIPTFVPAIGRQFGLSIAYSFN